MIWCFSGTGNSLAAANGLADRLNLAPPRPLARLAVDPFRGRMPPRRAPADAPSGESFGNPTPVLAGDPLVLVFPVYAFGPPKLVADLLARRPKLDARRIYAVATCGGTPGAALSILDGMLRPCGGALRGGFLITEWDKWAGRVEARLDAIAAVIREGGGTSLPGSNLLLDRLSLPLYRGFCRKANVYGRRFRVSSACTRCGLCQRVCPVDNITLAADGRPRWGKHCEACFACYAWCPTRAIEYGWMKRVIPTAPHPKIRPEDLTALKLRG